MTEKSSINKLKSFYSNLSHILKDNWVKLDLLLGILLIIFVTLTFSSFWASGTLFIEGLIYSSILILYSIKGKKGAERFYLILGIAVIIRIIAIYQTGLPSGSFSQPGAFKDHDWVGFLFSQSFDYVTSSFPLFEIGTILIDSLTAYLILMILKKQGLNKVYIILYLWNPFVIQEIYSHWNPYILWAFLVILTGVLLLYQKRFWAALSLGFSIGFYDLSFLLLPMAIRSLRGFSLIAFLIPFGFLNLPKVKEFIASKTIGSDFIQALIHFIPKSNGTLHDYLVLAFISLALSIIIWESFIRKEFIGKVFWSLLVITLAYPPFFEGAPFILIALGVAYRNTGVLVLSLYLFMRPALASMMPSIFLDYDLYWQYGLYLGWNLYPSILTIKKQWLKSS